MEYLNDINPTTLDQLSEGIIRQINHNIGKRNTVMLYKHDIGYMTQMSNSHSCPKSGVQNFMRNSDNPKWYPGWQGRVWLILKKDSKTFTSDVFRKTLAYPGTGGSGLYNLRLNNPNLVKNINERNFVPCSWDYKIWSDDWPLIQKTIIKEHKEENVIRLLNQMAIIPKPNKHSTFTYIHPDF